MSFGGGLAKAAAAAVAAEADEELEDSFSGLKFPEDEEESDNMSVSETSEREKMASEDISIASSAASIALEEARAEVAKLRTEKYLMEQQLAKKVASPNKIFQDKILKETTRRTLAAPPVFFCRWF